jgi:3-hydroxybutyryl-CoA dehydrogenase
MSSIQTVGIIGSGTMGNGIAQACATQGIRVVMVDIAPAAVDKGLATIAGSLDRLIKKEKISAADKDAALALIQGSTNYDELKGAQLVIEAATENEGLKVKILQQLDGLLAPDVIVATNTSSISITKLAAETSRPQQVIGMHFMNPVPVMKLVEVIRGLATSDETYQATVGLAADLGKTVITSLDSPGFIVNRILIPLINEACFALQEGLGSAEDIDTGAKLGLNHPMGPLELADLIGLDTCLAIADVLHRELGDDKYRAANVLRMHVAAGWHGRKTGRGFYTYPAR